MSEETYFSRVIFSNDAIINNTECGLTENTLWCYFKGLPLVDAFNIFDDINKYSMITFEYGLPSLFKRITYTGIEDLMTIYKTESGIDVGVIGSNIKSEEETISINESGT